MNKNIKHLNPLPNKSPIHSTVTELLMWINMPRQKHYRQHQKTHRFTYHLIFVSAQKKTQNPHEPSSRSINRSWKQQLGRPGHSIGDGKCDIPANSGRQKSILRRW